MSNACTRSARRARVEPLERRALLSALALGSEFRVNDFTTSSQLAARVAAAPDGSFVVVYASTGQAGPAGVVGQDVYARRYDASGAPVGSEFLVNTTTVNHQELPSIAMDDSGNFVVVWHSFAQDNGTGKGVYGQRFNAAGAPQGSEFLVNETTAGDQGYPTVAMDSDGDFVVAWESYVSAEFDVWARRYNASGAPLSAEFRVSNTTVGLQAATSVGMDDAGNFVVTWAVNQAGSTSYDIYARRFNAAGTAQGNEFPVNATVASSQYFPWIAVDGDGDFVVVWQSNLQDGNLYGVYARRFNAAGAAQGSDFAVNTTTSSDQDFPYVSMDDAGNFVVAWESLNQDAALSYGAYARAFLADGTPSGGEFRANSFTTGDQSFPAVALADDDRFVVVWQSRNQDASSFGIYAQRYTLDIIAPGVTGSTFHFATKPHKLRFTFSEDVSASLQASDVTVVNLAGGPPLVLQLDGYDSGTNTATFSFPGAPNGGVLPDGRYNATINPAGVSDLAGNPLGPANLSLNFFFMLADANHDERVNVNDFTILAGNFNQSPRDFTQGDFNYDSTVNVNDFTILAGRFNTILPAMTSGFGTARIGTPASTAKRPIDALRDDLL